MFGYTIIKKSELSRLQNNERKLAIILVQEMEDRKTRDNTTYNCGYKSCQFHTTDEKGLKIHRSRVHKKK